MINETVTLVHGPNAGFYVKRPKIGWVKRVNRRISISGDSVEDAISALTIAAKDAGGPAQAHVEVDIYSEYGEPYATVEVVGERPAYAAEVEEIEAVRKERRRNARFDASARKAKLIADAKAAGIKPEDLA